MVAEIRLTAKDVFFSESTSIVGDCILVLLKRKPDRTLGASEYGDVDGVVREIGEVPAEGGVCSVQVELVWRQFVVGGEGGIGGKGGGTVEEEAIREQEGIAAWLTTAEEWSGQGGGGDRGSDERIEMS